MILRFIIFVFLSHFYLSSIKASEPVTLKACVDNKEQFPFSF